MSKIEEGKTLYTIVRPDKDGNVLYYNGDRIWSHFKIRYYTSLRNVKLSMNRISFWGTHFTSKKEILAACRILEVVQEKKPWESVYKQKNMTYNRLINPPPDYVLKWEKLEEE